MAGALESRWYVSSGWEVLQQKIAESRDRREGTVLDRKRFDAVVAEVRRVGQGR
jgi:hypothetical protein